MFHAGGHKGVATRGRASGLGRHYPHFLSHVDWKAPLRCGILFCTFSCILSVVGVILTWLGVHDVFGESVPITGPILLAVGGLMLILAFRQFCVAHVRKKAHNLALKKKELGENTTAAMAERDGEHDFLNTDADVDKDGAEDPNGTEFDNSSEKPPLISGGCYDLESNSHLDPLNIGGYIWPPVPLQHPYYSMAMMVYKDTLFNTSSHVISPGLTDTYSFSPVVTTGLEISEMESAAGQTTCEGISSSLLSEHRDTAMLATSSTTVQHPTQPPSSTPQTAISGSRQECSKIFPADYLTPNKRKNAPPNRANVGISSLPNPTAFMMLRTLELQETI